jgi:hypothetical protein
MDGGNLAGKAHLSSQSLFESTLCAGRPPTGIFGSTQGSFLFFLAFFSQIVMVPHLVNGLTECLPVAPERLVWPKWQARRSVISPSVHRSPYHTV